ncbi:hypothetical protein PROVRETT_06895 [Providencia rettgeri DSM 1131]|nr:hypothetical protein PROVRETT_06895 [Providencia rettgeri DSM 1131]
MLNNLISSGFLSCPLLPECLTKNILDNILMGKRHWKYSHSHILIAQVKSVIIKLS